MNTCKRKAGGASSESGDSNDLPQTSGRQQSYESEPATEPLGLMTYEELLNRYDRLAERLATV